MCLNVSVVKLCLYVSECVCSKIMSVCVCSKIIKELSGLVGSGTPYIIPHFVHTVKRRAMNEISNES